MGSPRVGVEAAAKIAMWLSPSRMRQRFYCRVASHRKQKLLWRGVADPSRRRLPRRKSERPLKALDVSRPDFRIDETRRPLAAQRIEHLFGGNPRHILARLLGHARRMRARDHIVELQQRVVGRR